MKAEEYVIRGLEFGVLGSDRVERMSVAPVEARTLYNAETRRPEHGGPLDGRLGVSRKVGSCETCGESLQTCPGHFGHIRLALPVFHIGLIKHTVSVLTCICKSCSALLILSTKRSLFKRAADPEAVKAECKKAKRCFVCTSPNGIVRRSGLRIYHEVKAQNDLRQQELNALTVLRLFKGISDDDLSLIGLRQSPCSFIVEVLPVPPACIRPSVEMNEDGFNEDDLTVKLSEIAHANQLLSEALYRGVALAALCEEWDALQLHVATLVNAELPGTGAPPAPVRGLVQRLKGKTGRFRGNLSGKRVDFTGRSVVSPDPNLSIEEVGIPQRIARILTISERVTEHNKTILEERVRRGPSSYPGANYVVGYTKDKKEMKRFLQHVRSPITLSVGDVVERHLVDGDILLFNRQPSLHRISIMAHRARIHSHRTVRINECDCAPYNADFDGDEMNVHVPQTIQARVEAAVLLAVRRNMCTPRNGDPLVACTQDFVTCSWLFSSQNVFFDKQAFAQLCASASCFADANNTRSFSGGTRVSMRPAVLQPAQRWTGKQLFSAVIAAACSGTPSRSSNRLPEHRCDEEKNFEELNGSTIKGISKDISKGISKGTTEAAHDVVQEQRGCSPAYLDYLLPLKPDAVPLLSSGTHAYNLLPPSSHTAENTGGSLLHTADARRTSPASGSCSLERVQAGDPVKISGIGDSRLLVRGGRMLCGRLDKSAVGAGGRRSSLLIQISRLSPVFAARALSSLSRLSARALSERGFSIGIDDVYPSEELLRAKEALLLQRITAARMAAAEARAMMRRGGADSDSRHLAAEAGTAEMRAAGLLSKVREECGAICLQTLRKSNTAVVMQACGAKGSKINISQMVACVGQQMIGGQRITFGMGDRTLPHFVREDSGAGARGFVLNSFFSGLSSFEFLFHAASGRIGLVDTAVKTAETGYMQRRLMKALEDLRVCYDGSVRNSSGDLVQIRYGEDGWDPLRDAGEELFLWVFREAVFRHSRWLAETGRVEAVVQDIDRCCDLIIAGVSRCSVSSSVSLFARLRDFIRQRKGESFFCAGSYHAYFCDRAFLTIFQRVLEEQLASMSVDPGTAVGALAGQSIGEPTTQMTLETFHFAGVASANITLGVPRIREIINATLNIATPAITAQLVDPENEHEAKRVAAKLERTTLRSICRRSETRLASDGPLVRFELDGRLLASLRLSAEVVARSVARSLKEACVEAEENVVCYRPKRTASLFALERAKRAALDSVVCGLASARRVLIMRKRGQQKGVELVIEGTGLQEVLGTAGVDSCTTTTNDIIAAQGVLGIEAARSLIINEIESTMGSHGIRIDVWHVMLLADTMTFRGTVLGITRFGISKMRASPLMLASFEQTADYLFNAAASGAEDPVCGVSEAIITGSKVGLGTGIPTILWDEKRYRELRSSMKS